MTSSALYDEVEVNEIKCSPSFSLGAGRKEGKERKKESKSENQRDFGGGGGEGGMKIFR